MPITPFLIGQRFDLETKRVLGVAFDLVCNTLQTEACDDYVKKAIATKIIELAKAGERNSDILCEKALEEICNLLLASLGWLGRPRREHAKLAGG